MRHARYALPALTAALALALAACGTADPTAPAAPTGPTVTAAAAPATTSTTPPSDTPAQSSSVTAIPPGHTAAEANLTAAERDDLARRYNVFRTTYRLELDALRAQEPGGEQSPGHVLMFGPGELTPADIDVIAAEPMASTPPADVPWFVALFGPMFTANGHDPLAFIEAANGLGSATAAALAN